MALRHFGFPTPKSSSGTTLICLISVGSHLELCIADTLYWEYRFFTKITWVISLHTKEYGIIELVEFDNVSKKF